ncbi:UPF0291 protein [Compostibacillus humi]|jgi:uncharacterized protein YnzC (UPF0291/DUF896 family)|uniref:UPF0291 protein GCM10010978_12250 n=1 Tax=Compostibacillus humi TaxID=1245525 RepID=A0A8J2ZRL2_9BACI|nr:DUF896 domain-containing protein [Compostibacillus humi]GGH73905.1 UPF0291 protein [Compostibacillus humi]HLT56944.1 DUF896 domain-containing protein [Bacillota bacterium]
MLSKDKLNRINELAKKAKETGLTTAEQKEQQRLREEYLSNVRSSFKNQLKTMTVIDPRGNDVTPAKVRELQQKEAKKKK